MTPKEPLAAHAFELKNPDEVWQTPIETSDGAVVIQLKEKNAASRDEFDKNKAAILGPMTRSQGQRGARQLRRELRKKAGDKLKVDPRYDEEPSRPPETTSDRQTAQSQRASRPSYRTGCASAQCACRTCAAG